MGAVALRYIPLGFVFFSDGGASIWRPAAGVVVHREIPVHTAWVGPLATEYHEYGVTKCKEEVTPYILIGFSLRFEIVLKRCHNVFGDVLAGYKIEKLQDFGCDFFDVHIPYI